MVSYDAEPRWRWECGGGKDEVDYRDSVKLIEERFLREHKYVYHGCAYVLYMDYMDCICIYTTGFHLIENYIG